MSAYPDTKHRSYTKGRKGIIPLMSNLVKLCSITVWIHECENTDLKKAFTHTYIVDIAVSLFLSAKILQNENTNKNTNKIYCICSLNVMYDINWY